MLPHNSDQTNLSADVAPFVPRKEFQNDSGYVEQGPNPLPRYVTTCYPFVQEQQNGRVPIQPVGSQFVPVSYIGDSTSIHPPPVPTPHNPIVVGMVPPNAGYSAPGGDGIPLLFNNVVHQSVPNHMSTANSTPKHRNIEKSSKRVSRKNVATQNESTTANENNFSADVQMVDSCQQTDFPVAIASKSLTERPSPLKKTRNRRHRSSMLVNSDDRESSSDHADADIDSDSGYYSPKHRMVQKRSGGTSTSELTSGFHQNRLTGGNTTPVSRVVYLAPSPALYQVQAPLSQQVMSGMLSPHPTPPPSLLLTPPGTPLLSQSPVISRPPPGFPPPPNYLKPQWSGPLFLNNHPQFAGSNLNPHMVPTNQFYPGNNPQFSQRGRNRRPNYSPKHRWQAPQQFPTNSVPTSQFSGSDNSYDKRKQDRRKVTMQELFHDHRAFANGVSIPTQDTNSGILLSDTQEFPGLGSPSMINQSMLVGSQLSYSDAVLGKTIIHQSPQTVQLTARNSASPDDGSVQEKLQAQKNRKRQKKAERASKAADEEYAEISEEQENIKKALKKTAANRNRNKPSKFDLGEILSQQLKSKTMSGKIEMSGANMKDGSSLSNLKLRSTLAMPVNPLDSTAPMVKRGKERENPKPKKPSALKKVILKEREEKKEHRLSQLTTRDLPDTDVPPYPPAILDTLKSAQSHEEEIDHSVIENIGSSVPQIHSRRYREYCSQVLDKRIDETCTIILQKLVQFQDRLYQKDPMKAKMRRRLVMGIREVTKHLKLKKLKCVIVSPNLEKIQSKGGLDDALQQILDMCESQNVTYVFALGRKAMGRAVSKLVPVSIVGIFDYSGAEDQYKEMCSLVIEAQQKYKEMVSIYQQEVIDATNTTPTTTAVTTGGTSKRFPHMGHSRNPSAASCVSFASFISEPISEMNEGSNWRAMMDAQEEQTTLSPPPEVESDEEPTSSKMSTGGVANTNQHEDLCRKDSGSTVVECKDAQHPEETDELPEDLEIVHDLSSSLSSIHEEASTSASKNLDKSFSNSSTVVVLPRAEVPPIGAQSDDLCAEKPIDEASEVQNRIQMWLENASRSVQDMNLDLTPPEEENGPEEISSPEEDLIKDEPQEKGDEIEEQ